MDIIKQAIEFHKKGDFKNAEQCYLQFLEQKPDEAKAHHLLGALYMQVCDFNKAVKSLETAYRLDKSVPIRIDLALCLYELKEYRACFFALQEVLKTTKNKILYEKILDSLNKLELGEPYVKYALEYFELYGEDIEIMKNAAGYAIDIGRFDVSELYNKRLIELFPDDYVAHNNLALTYEFQLNFPLAEKYYRKTIEIKPNLDPIYNLSVLLRRMRRYDESLKMLELSKEYGLSDVGYDCTLGLYLLTLRNFSGYSRYMNFVKSHHNFSNETQWDGTYDKDSVLVLRATEGYGDVFMFSRYLDCIDTDSFKDVLLVVPTPLLALFSFNFPNFKVVDWKVKLVNNLVSAIVMDLPNILKLDFEHIPSNDKYLMASPEYCTKWNEYFDESKFNIGFFYSGNFSNKRTLRNRNVPFEVLKPLFGLDDEIKIFALENEKNFKKPQFYSLQPEEHFREEAENQNAETHNVISLSGKLEDFSDTAAVIEKLDLVITIDSSVAHLAGALGKKTFMLLPYSTDWRWFEDTNTTIWYSSMQIFRQEKEGEWELPFKRLKEAVLSEILGT